MANYTLQYPPAHNDTYVKATTSYYTNLPYYSTDPIKPLTGSDIADNNWYSNLYTVTNQRFHIDLGSAKIIRRIYYENSHNSGANTDRGVQNFTLWGSNEGTAFAQLTYATDTDWTQLTTASSSFDRHSASDAVDPKYINVNNTKEYRYYAFKFANNYGSAEFIGLRRIVLMTQDPSGGAFLLFLCEAWQRHKKLWTPERKLILPKDLGFSY